MSKVNRDTYQKAIEENKRLLADIKLLVMEGMTANGLLCRCRWKEKFENDKKFNKMLKIGATEYIKKHKDELPDFLTKSVVD